jgi:hypothetical protein
VCSVGSDDLPDASSLLKNPAEPAWLHREHV